MLPKAGEEATTEAQRQALAARARCKTGRGILAHKRRMADAEGVVGELKNQHALDRVRCRGTPLFHVQLLLACAALNCTRLADHAPEAASGIAGTPQVVAGDLPSAAAGARRAPVWNLRQPPPGPTPVQRPVDRFQSWRAECACLDPGGVPADERA